MKERVTEAIKVILMLGLSMVAIILLCIYEDKDKAHAPDKTLPVQQDTITTPEFYNQTPEEGLSSALIYYEVCHPDIVYAQAILETGHFKSKGCTHGNNLFGLYNSKEQRYYKFNHWTESIIAYKEWIQYRYKPPEDYYTFLQRIHYAEDPMYVSKLKQIVRKKNDKRRYTERDTIP